LGISEENPIWLRCGVIPPDDPQGRKAAEARSEFWRLAVSSEHRRSEIDGYHCIRRLTTAATKRCVGYQDPISLLRLQAHTGRLHQLRVHLAHIGHPVIGDKIYGPDPNLYLKFIDEGWTGEHQRVLGLSRHALHAQDLRFTWNGEELTFSAPVPEDMREYAERFGLKLN
jgi:23S rRNA pseudouridine1911/1915/1917 synthase